MPDDPPRPLLERLGKELSELGGEIGESLALRWQLALLEIKADLRSARRLAIGLGLSAVMILTALPLLLVALAEAIDGHRGLSTTQWTLLFGMILLLVAPAVAFLAWRRFRRRVVALEQTLEELHEDAVWLREWISRQQAAGSGR